MANIQVGGFRWVRSRLGGNTAPIEEMPVASNNSTAIFSGDIVKRVSDGTVIVAAAGDLTLAYVVVGCARYKRSDGAIVAGNYLPASTTYTGAPSVANPQASILTCIPLQYQILECDANTAVASETAAQDLVGNNCDFVATAGNTSTGRSGFVLDTSAPGTATANFRVLEIVRSPDNDVTSVNFKVRVTVNEDNADTLPGSATGV